MSNMMIIENMSLVANSQAAAAAAKLKRKASESLSLTDLESFSLDTSTHHDHPCDHDSETDAYAQLLSAMIKVTPLDDDEPLGASLRPATNAQLRSGSHQETNTGKKRSSYRRESNLALSASDFASSILPQLELTVQP